MEVPANLICPITQLLMFDPVVTCDGSTFDRYAIEAWSDSQRKRGAEPPASPLTGEPLASVVRIPVKEGYVFKTKARAPTLCLLEGIRRPASAPPRPAVKEPDNGPRDPDRRRPLRLPQTPKSSLTRSAFGLRRPEPLPSLVYLARSVPSSFTRSMRLDTAFITTAFILTALTTRGNNVYYAWLRDHRLRFSRVCSTRYTPRAQSRCASASRLPSRPHMPTHIPPWLIIVHLYYYHGPPRPATTRTRLQRAVQPRMPHRPDMPRCHVLYWRLCNMRVRPTTA